MRCPKCSYERQAADRAPEGQCPACGIMYAQFQSAGPPPPPRPAASSPAPRAPTRRYSEPSKVQVPAWAIPAVAGLVIGYFAGREHIKYELSQTFREAAEGVTTTLTSALGGSEPPSEPNRQNNAATNQNEPAPFSVRLDNKSFQAYDYDAGIEDAITFTITFDNLTGKNIRAFDGLLTFTDLLDNTILSARLAVNDPISAGSQIQWPGKIDYNRFISKHQQFRDENLQNLKTRFDTKKILFADGSVKELE